MKKIFLVYQLETEEKVNEDGSRDTKKELRQHLETLDRIVKDLGYLTFIYCRDKQGWKVGKGDYGQIFKQALDVLSECDIVISESSNQAIGMATEIGYAMGLNKRIITIRREGKDNFLRQILTGYEHAEHVVYNDYEDLREKLSLSLT